MLEFISIKSCAIILIIWTTISYFLSGDSDGPWYGIGTEACFISIWILTFSETLFIPGKLIVLMLGHPWLSLISGLFLFIFIVIFIYRLYESINPPNDYCIKPGPFYPLFDAIDINSNSKYILINCLIILMSGVSQIFFPREQIKAIIIIQSSFYIPFLYTLNIFIFFMAINALVQLISKPIKIVSDVFKKSAFAKSRFIETLTVWFYFQMLKWGLPFYWGISRKRNKINSIINYFENCSYNYEKILRTIIIYYELKTFNQLIRNEFIRRTLLFSKDKKRSEFVIPMLIESLHKRLLNNTEISSFSASILGYFYNLLDERDKFILDIFEGCNIQYIKEVTTNNNLFESYYDKLMSKFEKHHPRKFKSDLESILLCWNPIWYNRANKPVVDDSYFLALLVYTKYCKDSINEEIKDKLSEISPENIDKYDSSGTIRKFKMAINELLYK